MTPLPPGPAEPSGHQPQQHPYQQYPYQPSAPQPWVPQGSWAVDPMAPFGRDPFTGRPLSDKSRVAAGVLQIFLGTLGVGRFYTGHTTIAVLQLVGTVVGVATSWLGVGILLVVGVSLWALVDGIVLLASPSTDARGLLLRS
ncbi:TM2 domain-containing protein [Cellulomonas citrea]|uniref:TM2 domain-containing protein n=1 Tax=Cellulomonas citrea TaxID=1909423 RepID=UPI00135695AA|nr:TM2 domain-containing protein [Cellulomonas citrea]